MVLWILLMAAVVLLGAAALLYLVRNVRRFTPLKKLAEKSRAAGWLVASAAVLLPLGVCFALWGAMNGSSSCCIWRCSACWPIWSAG